jgi:multiple sugar transport system substrate-binding protein
VFTWYPFMWMGGGDITGPDGKTSAFNSPGTVAALKLWKDLVEKGYAPREVLSGGAWDLVGNMGAGYCAMQNCGIWGLSAMKTGAPDTPFGVFKLPTPTADAKPVTVAGGWAFAVNAKGKDPESAAKFAVWALGGDDAACKQRMLDWVTKAKTDMPPRKSVADLGVAQGAYAEGPLRVFAQEILPTARGEPRTPPEVWNLITDAIQACMLNGEDPATVAQTTDQKINSFLATYSGARIV